MFTFIFRSFWIINYKSYPEKAMTPKAIIYLFGLAYNSKLNVLKIPLVCIDLMPSPAAGAAAAGGTGALAGSCRYQKSSFWIQSLENKK